MRYAWLLLLLAGCDDGREAWNRSLEQRGVPYHTGETRDDRAGRFIMLHSKGYNMSDAELSEYLELDAELHPTAARAEAVRSGIRP